MPSRICRSRWERRSKFESQVLAARGQRTQAVALLQTALQTYGNTSIRARLQKNLNLLSLQGKVAPALKSDQFLGAKLPAAGAAQGLAGAAVLLGALVRRLQGGGADHHAAAHRSLPQGIDR